MNECLFCQIIAQAIPSVKVFEDEQTYAFLDIHPVQAGHILVIPKKHAKDVLEVDKQTLDAVMSTVQHLGKALVRGLGIQGFNLIQNTGPDSGAEVDHLHFHLIPRYPADGLKLWPGGPMASQTEREAIAKRIQNGLK